MLRDALDAISETLEFAQGVDLDQFTVDRKTQRATSYAFAVLGEALSKLQPAYRNHLTDHRPAIAMRNRLIHGYSSVDMGSVCATVQQDIDNLRDEFEGLLSEE